MTTQTPPQLSDAERLADGIAGRCRQLVVTAQREDLAPALEDRRSGQPAVAVIGETKRGKSALVNALIGRPGLSPVAPDVATCVPITFEYADEEWCRVWLEGQAEPLDITLAELHAYASEQENPGNKKEALAVEAGLPAAALADLDVTLIDTPGVGGLDGGHAELTLQVLGSADAIIFVLDLDGELSGAEYRFLRRASQRIDTIIFALTKSDLINDWERVVEENAMLLAENMPSLGHARFVPFSSLVAERAWPMPPGPQRTEKLQEAGLFTLLETIRQEVTRRAHVLQAANTLRACLSALDETEYGLRDRLIVAEANPEQLAELDRRQEQLKDLQYQQATWKTHLFNRLQAIESEQIDTALDQRLEELKRNYIDQANKKTSAADFEELAAQLVNATKLAVAQTLEDVELKLHQAVEAALGDIQHSVDVTALFAAGLPSASLPDRKWRTADTKKTMLEHYRTVWPAMGVHSLLVAVPGFAVLGPFGLLAVVPFAALAIHGQNAVVRRNQFIAWVGSYLVGALKAARQTCRAMTRGAKDESVDHELYEVIRRRLDEIAAAKKDLEQSLRNDAQQRATATAEARARLDALNALRRDALLLIGQLQGEAGAALAAGPAASGPRA
jgi:tRNA U34 5-carboxymethylaminomethyl modifying GTPase MnmE/TrmE